MKRYEFDKMIIYILVFLVIAACIVCFCSLGAALLEDLSFLIITFLGLIFLLYVVSILNTIIKIPYKSILVDPRNRKVILNNHNGSTISFHFDDIKEINMTNCEYPLLRQMTLSYNTIDIITKKSGNFQIAITNGSDFLVMFSDNIGKSYNTSAPFNNSIDLGLTPKKYCFPKQQRYAVLAGFIFIGILLPIISLLILISLLIGLHEIPIIFIGFLFPFLLVFAIGFFYTHLLFKLLTYGLTKEQTLYIDKPNNSIIITSLNSTKSILFNNIAAININQQGKFGFIKIITNNSEKYCIVIDNAPGLVAELPPSANIKYNININNRLF